MKKENLKDEINRMSVDHLVVIDHMNTPTSNATYTTQDIAQDLFDGAGNKTGGVLSGLSRIKVDGEPIIEPRGRVTGSIRWALNKNISWDDHRKQIKEILKIK